MAGAAEVVVKYIADTSQIAAASGKLGASGSKAAAGARKAFLPAVAALAAVGAAAYKATGDASDLAETVNKSTIVFGKSAGGMLDWSKTTADSLGIGQNAALGAAATFGDMFTQLGQSDKAAAGASKQMVKLAADLGSFHNREPVEVMESLSAAFRGEYDSIQALVPTINAAAVEQRALADTGKKSAKGLTALDKALATQKLLMEGSKNATNDFAETSGSAANRQKILTANMEDFSATMGQALLPVFEQFLGVAQKVGDWIAKHPKLFQVMAAAVAVLAATIVILNVAMVIAAAATASVLLPVLAVVAGIAVLIAIGVLLYKNWDKIRETAQTVWDAIKTAAKTAFDWLKKNWPLLLAILVGPFGLAVLAIARNWDKIKAGAVAVKDKIVSVWNTVLTFFKGLGGKIAAAIAAAKTALGKPGQWAADAVGLARDAFEGLITYLKKIPGKITTALTGAASALKGPLNAVIGTWNSLRIPGFDLKIVTPGPIPDIKFKWGGYDLPNIDKLAAGGIVTRPTLALIGEAGPEAVVPLGRRGGVAPVINMGGVTIREELDVDRLVARLSAAVAVRA